MYVIACRGCFDSLIWFFSHNSSLQPLQIKTTNQTDLKGAGIFTRISFIFSRNGIEEEEDDSSGENSRLHREQLLSGDSSSITTTTDARSGDGKSTTERYTDYDLSPQLNFALRSELLLLVSMGIKESVMRLGRDYASHTVDTEEGKGSGTFQSAAEKELAADHASLINGIPLVPYKSTCNTTLLTDCIFEPDSATDDSNSNPNPMRSRSFHNMSRHIMSSLAGTVLGTHLPGDYGVDPIMSLSTSAVADFDSHRASSLRHTTSSYSHSRISGAHLDTMIVVGGGGGESKDNHHNMNGRLLSQQVHDQRRDSESRSVDGIDTTSILLSNTAGGLHLLHPPKSGRSSKPPPKEVVFNIDSKHQFRDFRPLTFQLLRQLSGISEEDYLTFIAQPTKERSDHCITYIHTYIQLSLPLLSA